MRIIITGDFCPNERIKDLIEDDIQPSEILGDFEDLLKKSDLNITNLETSIKNDSIKKSKKIGPNLGSSKKTLDFLSKSGFNLVTLANNHFMDYGEQGALYCFDWLRKYGINYVGAGSNESKAIRPFVFEKDNLKIAVLNACENEFIGFSNESNCNKIDPVALSNQIKAVNEKADFIIMIMHGGNEHLSVPSVEMVDLYRFLIDQGADVVVNHHQHCCNGFEKYNNGLIFYGIGNFCFDNKKLRNAPWNQGFAVGLEITNGGIDFELHPYIQCDTDPKIKLLSGEDRIKFDQKMEYLNSFLKDKEKIKSFYEEWIAKESDRYLSYLSPYSNRYFRFMARKKLIPSFIKGSHARTLYLMTACKSHFNVVKRILEEKIR